jgi:phosphohistidine phosphatase
MEVYLLRHAQAVSEWQDPMQPLSVSGKQDIERLANWQHETNYIKTGTIFHSGKLRAQQTAETLHAIGLPQAIIQQKTGLMPNDSVEKMAEFLDVEWPHLYPNKPNLLLVGHLPYLDRLLGLLLFNHPDKSCVDIQPCTLICLTSHYGSWMIKWVMSPELLKPTVLK